MSAPNDLKYLKTHEWHKNEGGVVIIGITDHAAQELTDITFVQLPSVGQKIKMGDPFGEAESVKATSDLYCGIDGEIVEVNEKLRNDPGLVNRDPFGDGWIVKVRPLNIAQLDNLLSSEEYQANV
ncbi:MAG: glycine cleavage system protein GcvH [Phycisphaerae bacterium]